MSKSRSLSLVTVAYGVAFGGVVVVLWFALALFGVAASPSDAWWLFLGALSMLAMFIGASIPMMETRSLQRRPGYIRT